MRLCEGFVKEKKGQDITLVVKPMRSTIKCDDMIHHGLDLDYQIKKVEFERIHFKVINRAQFVKVADKSIVKFTRHDLVCAYQHLRFKYCDPKTGESNKSFIDRWLQDPQMRMYEDIDNRPPPLVCPDNVYTMWSGFAVENHPLPARICLDHATSCPHMQSGSVHDRLGPQCHCPPNSETWREVSHMMVLKAGQGQGKNVYFESLHNMVGEVNSVVIDNPQRDLFGNFNAQIRDKLLVCLNEGDGKVNNKYIEQLKQLVTDPKISINDKNDKVYKNRNFFRIFMLTNNLFTVSIDVDDRRFFLWESIQPLPSKEYFSRYCKAIVNKDALRLLLQFYRDRDISGWDPKNDRPETDLMIETKDLSLSPVKYWAKERAIALVAKHLQEETETLKFYFEDFQVQQATRAYVDTRHFAAELREMHRTGITGLTFFKNKGQAYVKWEVAKILAELVKEQYIPADWKTRGKLSDC